MNVKQKLKFKKYLVIILAWVCIGTWIGVYDHFTLLSEHSKGLKDNYSLVTNIAFNAIAGLAGALMGGAFLVYYVEEKFREKSYGYTLLTVAISFVIIVSIITVLLGMIFVPIQSNQSIFTTEGFSEFKEFIKDPIHIKNILIWAMVVSLTQFFLQINSKFGQGVLLHVIKGTYRNPQREKRIFMFVDIKSSTAIAERLGNEKYHEMLKDFFRDITNPIVYNRGQIYQYVGDEVVVSWPFEAGISNHHCLQCFFDMRQTIRSNAEKYHEKYGFVPEFKAGLHYGFVTAGEIGVIKRDITYSGDVLNTTARIQSKCNELKASLLASRDLIELVRPPETFTTQSLGFISLRGKQRNMELYSIHR